MRRLVVGWLACVGSAQGSFHVGNDAYSTHELNDITSGVQLHDLDATPAAFGDFDSDQYTDMFVVPPTRDEVRVLLWDHAQHIFTPGPVARHLDYVVNVVASDFNMDGRLDLLVYRDPGGGVGALGNASLGAGKSSCTMLTFIPGLNSAFGDPVDLAPAFGQPLVLNADDDMAPDLFGEACANDGALGGRGKRAFWLNDGRASFDRTTARMGDAKLAEVPSPAAVDLDGDCRADLVLPTRREDGRVELEVWLATDQGLADYTSASTSAMVPEPSRRVVLPRGVQQLTWADFNGDGAQDAVSPACDDAEGCGANSTSASDSLLLITRCVRPASLPTLRFSPLSPHHPLPGATTATLGLVGVLGSHHEAASSVSTKKLCRGDPDFRLEVSSIAIDMLPPTLISFVHSESRSPLHVPPTVRAGDFDMDGFTDLVVGLEDEDGRAHVAVLRNRKGEAFDAMAWRTNSDGSIVISDSADGEDGGGSLSGAHAAAFFDVDESGNLDLLLLTGTAAAPAVRLYRNAFSSDDYFLKVMSLNGLCLRWCGNGEADPMPPPYGVNTHGITYAFASTSATGSKRLFSGTQLSSSAHSPLATPFVLFGLGRTNDYVNEFYVGLPTGHRRRFDAGIIPNSQLIAIPTPPDKPARWTIELYISKASLLPWVALAVSAGLVIIGAVVVLLEWRERLEDAREKKAMAPSLPL